MRPHLPGPSEGCTLITATAEEKRRGGVKRQWTQSGWRGRGQAGVSRNHCPTPKINMAALFLWQPELPCSGMLL